jgi:sulfate adenylyltransferase subunit 1
MIVKSGEAQPAVTKAFDAYLCWLSEAPLEPSRRYLVRHTTRTTQAKLGSIAYKLDINSLEQLAADKLQMNDIARVTIRLAHPVACDPYGDNRGTGAFIVIDESTNNTVGAGMIVAAA